MKADFITVVYGRDEVAGVFLDVFDKRLESKSTDSKKVNVVIGLIGIGDGRGCYFSAHTAISRFGFRVSDQTMLSFLRRFNVPTQHIAQLDLNVSSV